MNWQDAVFVAGVAAPAVYLAPRTPERLRDLREGAAGFAAVPVAAATLAGLAALVQPLLSHPVLGWAWLGHNVALGPVSGAAGGSAGAAWTTWAALALLLPAVLHFNYYEEKYYRASWGEVTLWAALHVAMGIPVVAAVPILGTGVVYKALHDRYGMEHAYAAHFGTNALLLSILAVALAAGA